MRSYPLLVVLALVPVISCTKPPAPPAATPAPCVVESAREIKAGDRTELLIWNLRTFGLKQLTARLLVFTDGKVQTATEVKYQWESREGSAAGELVLLIQDGKGFGAKGRMPLLALNLQGSPPPSKTESTAPLLVNGELHPLMTVANTDALRLTERSILYAQLFVPHGSVGTLSLVGGETALAESSKAGRTVVAVALEWAVP